MTNRGVDADKRATLRRFAAVGAASPLTSLADGDGDEGDVRTAIRGYLSSTPGAHFSKLRDDLRLGTGETQHHLRALEEAGTVESRKDGDYRRFYPAERFSEFEQIALGHLRRETPRGMVIQLLRSPGMTGADLATELGVSAATVSKHASRLAEDGLLSAEDGYAIRNPEIVLTLLVRYADSFGEIAAAFAAEADTFIRFDP